MNHNTTMVRTTWVATPVGRGKLAEIYPVEETKSLMQELVASYKTPASKKAFLTRTIHQTKETLQDVVLAVSHSNGWLFGEVYTERHVAILRSEVRMLQQLKSEIM